MSMRLYRGCYRGQLVGVDLSLLIWVSGIKLGLSSLVAGAFATDPPHQPVGGLFMLFVPDGKNE